MASGRPLRTLRFLGHGPADQLGPVCDPADRTAVAATLKSGLRRRQWPWDIFIAERLGGAEGWASLLGGKGASAGVEPGNDDRRPRLGRLPRLAQLQLPAAGDTPRAKARARARDQLPARRSRLLRDRLRAAGPTSRVALGRALARLRRSAGGLPSRFRLGGARARMAAPVVARGRRHDGGGLARVSLRRLRELLPVGARSRVGQLPRRLRAAHPHDARGVQRRHARVPHAARSRGLQGPVRQQGSRR